MVWAGGWRRCFCIRRIMRFRGWEIGGLGREEGGEGGVYIGFEGFAFGGCGGGVCVIGLWGSGGAEEPAVAVVYTLELSLPSWFDFFHLSPGF